MKRRDSQEATPKETAEMLKGAMMAWGDCRWIFWDVLNSAIIQGFFHSKKKHTKPVLKLHSHPDFGKQ